MGKNMKLAAAMLIIFVLAACSSSGRLEQEASYELTEIPFNLNNSADEVLDLLSSEPTERALISSLTSRKRFHAPNWGFWKDRAGSSELIG